jgi:hypothetical protein
MPRTFGRNQIHISQIGGLGARQRPPAAEVPPPPMEADDRHHRRLRGRTHSPWGLPADRHRRDPQRHHGRPRQPPRPRRAHRAAQRRSGRSRRVRGGQRRAQAAQPHQGGRHVRARYSRLYDFLNENTTSSCGARATSTTRASAQPRAQLRVHQRHALRRLPRPVRVGDDQRPLLLVVRWPGRLRSWRHVQRRRAGLHRAALHRGARQVSRIVPQFGPAKWSPTRRTRSTRWSPNTAWPSCAVARSANARAR